MTHTNLYEEYKRLEKIERLELTTAIKAHGGEYVFIDEDDEEWDEKEDVPIVCACYEYTDELSDYYVSRVSVNDKGILSIYGFDKECGSPSDERKLHNIEPGHIGVIIDFIKETKNVKDVSISTSMHKVYAAFGADLAEAVATQNMDVVEAALPYPEALRVRGFSTEAEAKAYIQGLGDSCGWIESSVLSPFNPFERKIIEKIDER